MCVFKNCRNAILDDLPLTMIYYYSNDVCIKYHFTRRTFSMKLNVFLCFESLDFTMIVSIMNNKKKWSLGLRKRRRDLSHVQIYFKNTFRFSDDIL